GAKELLALRLATVHNLRTLAKLMVQIRRAISEGELEELQRAWSA
ncbi:MAG TPA: tRNA guanosine(34) transglycosylase Tgt, partial [Candidatus Fraserbacteria bacterium]|nr:tRNA guanosine(34) transglycosylase Tgt [Candidatus Fraserbacteria bacterium]